MPAQNLRALTPEIWSKAIITRLDRINVMLGCGAVNRDYEGDIRGQGDTVWVRTYGNVAINKYTRNKDIDYDALQPSREALKVNDAFYFAFQVDDLDEAQNDLKALDGFSTRAAVAMNESIDTKLLSYYKLTHIKNRVTNAGNAITISATNAYTTLVDAGALLDAMNVPMEGRWAVVGPSYKSALLKDKDYFIRATDLGDEVVRTGRLQGTKLTKLSGFIGQCANFNLFQSNAVPVDATGAYCQFGAPGVISYAGQLRKIERIRRESTFGDALRGLVLHDATVFAEHAKGFGYILTDKP